MSEKTLETRTHETKFDKRGRRRFRTAELSDAEVEQIASARMDMRHDHLNALLAAKS